MIDYSKIYVAGELAFDAAVQRGVGRRVAWNGFAMEAMRQAEFKERLSGATSIADCGAGHTHNDGPPPKEIADLIKRLRGYANAKGPHGNPLVDAMCLEAAAALEALSAQPVTDEPDGVK